MARQNTRIRLGRRASLLLEFAICAPVFLLLLFVVFEVAYDLFLQEVLDSSLAVAARSVQTGNAQVYSNTANGKSVQVPMDGQHFLTAIFCPDTFGFLSCNGMYVRVEPINTTDCQDLYTATNGNVPVSQGQLQLSSYTGANGALGAGGTTPATGCDGQGGGTGFCDPGPNELVLMSVIYVGPSFIGGLLPGTATYSYNGQKVRAQLATTAFQTELFTAAGNTC